MPLALGWLAAICVLILPGTWLGFGLPLPATSFRARLALSVVAAPLVVLLQYYLLRWVGLSFEQSALVIPLASLPALLLIVRRRGDARGVTSGAIVPWLLPAGLAAGWIGMWKYSAALRLNGGHAWTHADITYLIANGQLRPEEPLMAGVQLAYPWTSHVFQAVISELMNTPPNNAYLLVNIVWLVAIAVLMVEITAALGGRRIAQVATAVLLAFGVNSLGQTLRNTLPAAFVSDYPIWGDTRYAPWIRKFAIFQQDPFGIGIAVALTFLLVYAVLGRTDWSRLTLTAILLAGAAILYPVMWPASAVIVGCALVVLSVQRLQDASIPTTVLTALVCTLLVGMIVLFLTLDIVMVDRAHPATARISSVWYMKVKTATSVVVLFPLLVLAAVGALVIARDRFRALALLGLAAFGLVCANILLEIYFVSNEYKFMFPAAACLAPIAGLAVERVHGRLGRVAAPVLVGLAVILAVPAFHPRLAMPFYDNTEAPALSTSSFDLRLEPDQPDAEFYDAIRTATPRDAVLVTRYLPFDIVTVTRRPLYIPLERDVLMGIGLEVDGYLHDTRGYARGRVALRRLHQSRFFAETDDSVRAAMLERIREEIGRPLVVITGPADSAARAWLVRESVAPIHAAGPNEAWLVGSSEPALTRSR